MISNFIYISYLENTCTALLTRLSSANIQWGLMLWLRSVEFTAS